MASTADWHQLLIPFFVTTRFRHAYPVVFLPFAMPA